MARPVYESDSDLAAEAEAARLLCKPHGLLHIKLPMRYEIDFMLRRGPELYGWLEVKVRPGVTKHRTYMVSLHKVMAGRNLASFGGRFLVLVRDGDKLMVLDAVMEQPVMIGMGGRSDRGDDQDIEPTAHFAWKQFTEISGSPHPPSAG